MKKLQNRWTNKELDVLKECFDKDMSYEQVANLLPNKTEIDVRNKIQSKRWTSHFRRKDCWTKEELDLLRQVYPKVKNDELEQYFPNKNKRAITTKATRMGLHKAYEINRIDNIRNNQKYDCYWNEQKNIELISIYNKYGEEYCYVYFKEKYNNTKKYIRNKLIDNKLIYYSYITKPNLAQVFEIYKNNLQFKNKVCNITKQQLVLLFRFYARKNNIFYKEYYLQNVASQILEDSSLKNLVKIRYGDYYSFFCDCFPNFNFKRWEFMKLDVPNNYWNNKYNCYYHIREVIKNLKRKRIIDTDWEILLIPIQILKDYGLNSSLLYFKGKEILLDYLSFNHVCIPNDKVPVFNNIKFDSFEECIVYKFIYYNITNKIVKIRRNNKYFNSQYNESYIPDFEIDLNNNKKIIIEYFGLYDKDHKNMADGYTEKTKRKTEYYSSLDDIIFIGIYPNDIKDNFKGVKDKFNTLLLYKK